MADGGIGLAGLILAVPGVVDVAIKYGEFIVQKVESFKHAKQIWTDLGTFGHSLVSGKLKISIELADKIYHTEDSAQELKKSLEDLVAQLGEDLRETKAFLQDIDVEGFGGRTMFAIRGQRKAEKLNRNLRTRQNDLSELLILNDMKTRQLTDEVLLSPAKFKHNKGKAYQPVPFTTHLFVVEGSYKAKATDTASRQVDVLVERHDASPTTAESSIHEIASLLHYRFADMDEVGILPCLGFRMDPAPELIFEIPAGQRNPQTLQTLIAAGGGNRFGVNHPLDHRFKLARELSEAILRVHSMNLVHKSVRSENIVILQPDVDGKDEATRQAVGFGVPYLTNWALLKETSGLSSMSGTADWEQNIYRHPNRQGIMVQERYNLGHDIYSLGVCLLEIGLWEPLVHVRTASGKPRVCDVFRATARVEAAVDPDAELLSRLGKPQEVKRILSEMARTELPARMGLSYMRLVIACLAVLDTPSGFGTDVDFRKLDQVERGVAFKELVLGYFNDRLT